LTPFAGVFLFQQSFRRGNVTACHRLCYNADMTNKTAITDKRRRTTMVPVTTMEEIPVLSEQERTELLTSLEGAEARAAAGEATDYDPHTFKDRLIGIYRGGKPS
jgi:hypothetical protein